MKRIIGILLLLLALAGLVNVVGKLEKTQTTSFSGSSAYDKGRKAGKYTAAVVLIVIGLFGLRLALQSPGVPPARSGQHGHSNDSVPRPGDPSLRGAQNTFASNPGRLRLDLILWLQANPWVPIVSLSLLLVGGLMLLLVWPVGLVLSLSAAILFYRQVRVARQKFFMGDVCPGVVLSAQQNLVAVYTNLVTWGQVPKPAIKILKQPLQRMGPEAAYDGMRVAAAALYYGCGSQDAWRDFSPEVINCVLRNPDAIARVLGSITEPEWQALDNCLARIPEARPGLYRLWDASTDSEAAQSPNAARFSANKPWFKTATALVLFSIIGGAIGLLILLSSFGSILRNHRGQVGGLSQSKYSPPFPAPSEPKNWRPAQTGPFVVGSTVSAHWAGKWVPGKVTAINPGGITLMVQLEDPRFKHPIVLSTNQVQPR